VNFALQLPKFILRLLFGKAKQNKTYEGLVGAYQLSLSNGGKAGSSYIPKNVSIDQRQKLISNLTALIKSLTQKIEKLTEEELDKYILPHPLIGKISIREMLYFAIYHVQHHQKMISENSK